MGLTVDFDKSSKEEEGLWVASKSHQIFVPYDKIGRIFAIKDGSETIIVFTEEIDGNPRLRIETEIAEIKALLPEESYLEIYADADEWNGDREHNTHMYVVMKSAIMSYREEDGRVDIISVSDAWATAWGLSGITQLSAESMEFLREAFQQAPDDHKWFMSKDRYPAYRQT